MKPNEHEYKLMGLAPYGKENYGLAALNHYRATMEVDGIEFKWKQRPKDSYYWFREKFHGERFDNIAWAIQTFVEESLEKWSINAVKKFGIGRIVFSGGVALNVKAMGRIARRPEVDDMFIMGSAADESLCIGACFSLAQENNTDVQRGNLDSLYLGTSPDEKEVDSAIEKASDSSFVVETNPTSSRIASLLADGFILARCVGPMEFGQRALGNRSILADPVRERTKERINQAIKNRDFWMPFAPIVLDSFERRYLKKPIPTPSPYMTLAFETTMEGYDAMPAACHPSDKTARAQILQKKDNPNLYTLLEAFAEVTGRGALLNTSFNLHGFPIVRTAPEAIHVLEKSLLDGVLFEKKLILRKQRDG
jgi:carbamoyltransferase